ncbi:MAG: Ig-like domain-containing protein [Ignavibacteria bacterium]|nr:Ig-like domain-containing protein [Ignavibacteria bacterium]
MAARHPSPRRHTGQAAPLLALLLFAACATQKPPDGGPPDTEPPTVLETEPPNGSTRFTGDRVRITFDEYVNRQSFQQALHIAPFMQTPPEISWSGRSVDIRFTEPLKENRTYVVTVGTALKDANGGNALAASTTLAFATGDSIDRGSFFGKVSDDKPAGVSLFAFALPDGRADTLNPSRVRPDYAAQCGQDGSFRFSNVAIGRYRVFAVRDRQADFFYDIETDDFGAPWGDIDLGVADSL